MDVQTDGTPRKSPESENERKIVNPFLKKMSEKKEHFCDSENSMKKSDPQNESIEEEEESDPIETRLGGVFGDIFDTVKRTAEKWDLLDPDSQDVLLKTRENLNSEQIDEMLRWYTRRPGWRLPLRKSKKENFEKLQDQKIVLQLDQDEAIEFGELLILLSKEELHGIAKTMMIDKKYRRV